MTLREWRHEEEMQKRRHAKKGAFAYDRYLIGGVLLDDPLDFHGGIRLLAGCVRWRLLIVALFEPVLIGGLVGGRRAHLLLLLYSFAIGRVENTRVSLHVA